MVFHISECGKSYEVTTEVEIVATPGYPYSYYNNMDCSFQFSTSLPSHNILLKFEEVSLEDQFDFLIVGM